MAVQGVADLVAPLDEALAADRTLEPEAVLVLVEVVDDVAFFLERPFAPDVLAEEHGVLPAS